MAKSKSRIRQEQKEVNLFQYFHFTVGLALVLVGAALLLFSAVGDKPLTLTLPKESTVTDSASLELSKPAKIYIPKMDRILPVADGYLIENRWTVSETGVSFYTDSAIPGKGNSVLYGHNRKGVLGGLWRLQAGDSIYVILKNGHFVKYQVSEEKEIKPTQVEILKKTPDSRLTLYTCSGFLDTARFVVIANQVQSVI